MKLQIILFLLLSLPMVCFSATTQTNVAKANTDTLESAEFMPVAAQTNVERHSTNFIKRSWNKLLGKAKNEIGNEDADLMAKNALIYGIISLGLLFIPYVGLLSIPAAILAIVKGGQALKGETKYPSKAKTGRAFGWATLGLIVLGAILIIVFFATFFR